MAPGEPAIILSSSLFTIAVQKHHTVDFPGTRLAIPNQISEFVVPRTLQSMDYKGTFLSSKVSAPLKVNFK